jgi:hypothetical protein
VLLEKGTKLRVKRLGARTVTGVVTNVFNKCSENYVGLLVEYRSYYSGGLYIAKPEDCLPYDRRLRRQKVPVE